MSEAAGYDRFEDDDGLSLELYECIVQFETKRGALYDFLALSRVQDREVVDLDPEATTMELSIATAEAFAELAIELLRENDRPAAVKAITDFWHEDDSERAKLLGNLSDAGDLIIFQREDIMRIVTKTLEDDEIDDDTLGSLLGTSYHMSLLGDLCEYNSALEERNGFSTFDVSGLEMRGITMFELQERARLLAAVGLAALET
jgi:hypothetical protein